MRGIRSAIAAVIALALLAGVAALVERWARSEVEQQVEEQVQAALPELDGEVVAQVGGRFVIPQVIGGTREEVTITSAQAMLDGFALTDVTVVAHGVPSRGNGSVDQVVASGTAPTHSVLTMLQSRVDLPDGVALELHDGEIAAVASVLGIPLQAYVVPVMEPRSISFEVSRFVLGDAEVEASSIPFDLDALLAGATVELDMLPDGVELTELTVTPDGVDVALEGSDVTL